MVNMKEISYDEWYSLINEVKDIHHDIDVAMPLAILGFVGVVLLSILLIFLFNTNDK